MRSAAATPLAFRLLAGPYFRHCQYSLTSADSPYLCGNPPDVMLAPRPVSVSMQVLRGDGAQKPYRGRVFLGADGVPVTFQARPRLYMQMLHPLDLPLTLRSAVKAIQ